MEMITVTAKTVEDAITQASVQLGVSSDRLQYEVVEKGSAGVLGGLFGSRPAIIRAKKIETVDDKAVEFLNSVLTPWAFPLMWRRSSMRRKRSWR